MQRESSQPCQPASLTAVSAVFPFLVTPEVSLSALGVGQVTKGTGVLSKSQSALGVECGGIPALTLSDSKFP